jgi:hypothetical protein
MDARPIAFCVTVLVLEMIIKPTKNYITVYPKRLRYRFNVNWNTNLGATVTSGLNKVPERLMVTLVDCIESLEVGGDMWRFSCRELHRSFLPLLHFQRQFHGGTNDPDHSPRCAC